jgi:DNA repair protein RadC
LTGSHRPETPGRYTKADAEKQAASWKQYNPSDKFEVKKLPKAMLEEAPSGRSSTRLDLNELAALVDLAARDNARETEGFYAAGGFDKPVGLEILRANVKYVLEIAQSEREFGDLAKEFSLTKPLTREQAETVYKIIAKRYAWKEQRATKAKEEDFAVATRNVKAVRAGRKAGAMRNSRAIYDFVSPTLVKYSQEVVLVIPLDLRGHPLNPKPYVVAMGQKAEVSVEVDDVIRPAIADNCSGFVVVHNHPSGKASPSKADRQLTDTIRSKAPARTPMIDHLVCGDGQFYSFADEKLYEV